MLEVGVGGEGTAEVTHCLLAVVLQVWHDVGGVVPPHQVQYLHQTHTDTQ